MINWMIFTFMFDSIDLVITELKPFVRSSKKSKTEPLTSLRSRSLSRLKNVKFCICVFKFVGAFISFSTAILLFCIHNCH